MLATLAREQEATPQPATTLTQPHTWPELRQRPKDSLRVPLLLRKGQRVKMPRGLTCRLASSPPATAWPRIIGGIEEFGLSNLYIYAPKEAFLTRKVDPAIIAEKNGKLYLIAAWQ